MFDVGIIDEQCRQVGSTRRRSDVLAVNHGQHDMGGTLLIMEHRIDGDLPLRLPVDGTARVQIAIEPGKTTARDSNTQSVSWEEGIARGPQIDLKEIDLPRLE